ncbi:MAG TPA: ABC transporter substrate-binding protein [Acidimicrobiia bacterium]|nr:ABC transporter substrate-binding protein [Acidimicrobiia bacterium]
MRRKNVRVGRRPVRATAVLVLLALAGSACAGDVGKYRNAQPGVGPTRPVARTASAATAESAAGPVDGSAVADAVTNPVSAVAASAGAGAVPGAGGRPASPAAPGASRASAGGSGSSAATGSTTRTGPSGPAPANAVSAAAGPTGPGQGGASPPTPAAPAPVPGGGTTTGVTKDAITIGLFYSKTGAYTGLFRNGPVAVQAAFDEAGPINGRRLVLKTYDDGTANASTIQVEEKRAKDEAFALMSIVSESNVVLAPVADQHKVPVVVGNIDEKIALPLTYAFPVFAFWARQATILPGFIKNVLGGGSKKIGIVYEGTSTAVDAKNAFKGKAKELGLNVVYEQPIAQNQSACANEVANLQAHGVEVVYMMNGPLGAICMLRDARAIGYKPTWTGVGMSWQANVVAQASGGGADGIRMLSSINTLDTPAGRHFSEVMHKYAPNSGADDDDVTMLYYATVQTLIEALRRAGPDLTREGFVQTMETKMSGYESGFLPPPTFGPKIRYGPTAVGVTACCTNGRWSTPQVGWRAEF